MDGYAQRMLPLCQISDVFLSLLGPETIVRDPGRWELPEGLELRAIRARIQFSYCEKVAVLEVCAQNLGK